MSRAIGGRDFTSGLRLIAGFRLVAALLLICMLLTACGGEKLSQTEQALRKDETVELTIRHDLNLPLQIPPRHLNPALAQTLSEKAIIDQLYEGLVTVKNQRLKLVQAESLTASEDNKIWTFVLRSDLHWSDGSKITAADYRRTWLDNLKPSADKILAESFRAFPIHNAKSYYQGKAEEDEVGIKADGLTLTITLDKADENFPLWLSQNFFYPYKVVGDQVLYNGAYVLKKQSTGGLELEANRHYWDFANLWIKSVHFQIIPDEVQAFENYHNKNFDMIGEPFYSIGKDRRTAAAKSPQKLIFPVTRMGYIRLLNKQHLLFNTEEKRQALYDIIDTPFQANIILQDGSMVWPERNAPDFATMNRLTDFFEQNFSDAEKEELTDNLTVGVAGPTLLENRLLVVTTKDWLHGIRVKFHLRRVIPADEKIDFIYDTALAPDGSEAGLLKLWALQGLLSPEMAQQVLHSDDVVSIWAKLPTKEGIFPLHQRSAMLLVNPHLTGVSVNKLGKLLISDLQWRPFANE